MRCVFASWGGILDNMSRDKFPILATAKEAKCDRSLIPERIKWVLEDQERAEEHGLVWLPDIFCWSQAEEEWYRYQNNLKKLRKDINRGIFKDTWMRDYEPYTTINSINYVVYTFMQKRGIKLELDPLKYDLVYFQDLYPHLDAQGINDLCEEVSRKMYPWKYEEVKNGGG